MKSGALPSSVIVATGSRGRGRDGGGTVASVNLLTISHLPPLPVGLSGSPHSHSPPVCPLEG